MTDPLVPLMFLRILTAPVAMAIAVIALISYLRFRNWRLLFLSAAFLILSIPPAIELVLFSGLFTSLSAWTAAQLSYIAFIFSTASIIPFGLLAYVYLSESNNFVLSLSRRQKALAGALVLAVLVLFSYELLTLNDQMSYLYASSMASSLLLLRFVTDVVTYLLIVLIVIFLSSYYRARKKENTLVVVIGFACLLIARLTEILSFIVLSSSVNDYYAGITVAAAVSLAGYVAFLVALLRLRVRL